MVRGFTVQRKSDYTRSRYCCLLSSIYDDATGLHIGSSSTAKIINPTRHSNEKICVLGSKIGRKICL